MNIEVTGDKIISTFQEEFHSGFPYLKIEFFQEGQAKSRIPGNKPFGVYGNNSHSPHITVTPTMTVAELENDFLAKYHLAAQVFRQSGKVWLETTFTDNWTLQEQNEQGKALSS